MPRRKRSRRHKKHNNRNHFQGNDDETLPIQVDQVRACASLDSPADITTKITEKLYTKTSTRTPSPKLEGLNVSIPKSQSLCNVTDSPVRKRRSVSRESSFSYLGLPFMFNLSENTESFISDLRTCQSSTILETRDPSEVPKCKFRSSSSMAKLHSPGIEKIPLKADTSTQTYENLDDGVIVETPRVNHDALLEFDYKVQPLHNTPVSGYKTPLKRMRFDSVTPIFDVKDTAVRIQDLNNLQVEQTGRKVLNCSRTLNSNSLKRLQNFNELILNTTQSNNYDNCELPQEVEELQTETNEVQEAQDKEVCEEISFFTPQLYNSKLASTPIDKNDGKVSKTEDRDKVGILNEIEAQIVTKRRSVSISTQVENPVTCHVGIQTAEELKITPVSKIKSTKEKSFTLTKRRTYKSLSPAVIYYRVSPKKEMKPNLMRRASLERSDSAATIATIESCARIIAKIKKYHGRYSSNLPGKIIEICTWLGLTVKKGVASLYKLYTQRKALGESSSDLECNKCNLYLSRISALTSTVDGLSAELSRVRQAYQEESEKLSLLRIEVDQFRLELNQFESMKAELLEIKDQLAAKPTTALLPPPPPPPPPPLPLQAPSNLLIGNRSIKVTLKKSSENSRPIISLDDILKVKLKKVGDRLSPMQRRATEPLVSTNALRQIKLRSTIARPQTPSSNGSLSGASSLSDSPRSSLTRMLTNVDTNVCRVKRLRRTSAYSFDDFSRRNRRERDSHEFI